MLRVLALALLLVAPSRAQDAPATADATAGTDAPAPSGAVTYTLDPAKSDLYVVVYPDPTRWTPIESHQHVVEALDFTGSVTWNADQVSKCDIRIGFPVTALAVDPPGMRERERLDPDGAIAEDTKKTVVNNMLGRQNLHGSQYKDISYQSVSCVQSGGLVKVTGDLTIRGVSKRIVVPMTITATPEKFHATGSFQLNHSDFGMSPFTYGPGTPKNAEALKFVIDVTGKPAG